MVQVRLILYVAVIAMSFTLPYPMNVIQAAIGGFAFGARLFMWLEDRTKKSSLEKLARADVRK